MSKQTPMLICPARRMPTREAVANAWEDQGWDIMRVSNYWDSWPTNDREDVSCYGGIGFCTTVSERLKLKLVEPSLDHICEIDYKWRRRHIRMKRIDSLASNDFPAFIKSRDYKLLPSAVYQSLDSFEYRSCEGLENLLVFVSEVVAFKAEARALIREQELVSIGPYHREDSSVPKGAERFIQDFLAENSVPEVCVVDIGLLNSGNWVLVEMNPVWAADPLRCNLETFVHCLRKASGRAD
ncbi:MAG TPA: ATP-grasp domain-containing protein [Thermoanaerobaculia bacterium]|nr:ATP-grasp domain-containing protein [Thermoanaerobaculia bacterium]